MSDVAVEVRADRLEAVRTSNGEIPTTMRALVKREAGPGAELQIVPVPSVGPADVLIHVDATSICGTDLHIYRWDDWASHRMHLPLVFGHEFCGTVVQIGSDVTRVTVGDFIAGESHVVCGRCRECRAGQLHICRNLRIIGVDRAGAYAQYISIPEENAWTVPASVPVETATIEEPLGNAVHTVTSMPVSGATVAIFGLGPLGLFAISIARVYGAARIFGIELSPVRIRLAEELGIDVAIDPGTEDVVARLLAETGGEGVDVLLEMSGNETALAQGLASLRPGGSVALLGLPSRPIHVDLADGVIFKGATIKGITGRRIPETWYQTRGLLEAGIDLSAVITHRMPLAEYERAFSLVGSGETGKVILYPNR